MKIEIYCDESRQDLLHNKNSINENNRYSIIGGIWINGSLRENLKNNIKYLRKKHDTYGEIKWQTVSNSKIEFYKELIELFFEYDDKVKFRCIVIDAKKVNINKYHDSDAELGFYKFYYYLIYYWLKCDKDYYVFTDYKVNRKNNRIIELKEVLNNACHCNCIKHIQAIDSNESLILQLEDVIMGAVGYKYNFGTQGKSEAKNKIVKLIEERIGFKIEGTPSTENKFNIFEIDLNSRERL